VCFLQDIRFFSFSYMSDWPNATAAVPVGIEIASFGAEVLLDHVSDEGLFQRETRAVDSQTTNAAVIGAGSVVTHDVPDYALMVSRLTRKAGWICACGQRLDENLYSPACGSAGRRIDEGLEPDMVARFLKIG
jgi:hypothetical protein